MSPLRGEGHPVEGTSRSPHNFFRCRNDGYDYRCGLQFLGLEPLGADPNPHHCSSLHPRMEATTQTCATPLRPLTANGLPCRVDNYSLRHYLATRYLRRLAAYSPHDSTSVVDDGRAPSHTLRRTLSTTSVRVAP